MNDTDMMLFLKALADDNRLKIVSLLSVNKCCACELLEHFEFSQPALSHHMKILEKAKIVKLEKKGKWVHYSLNKAHIHQFVEVIKKFGE